MLWEWFGKATNDAWKRGCVLHGSQEWGWEGFGKAKNEAWKVVWVFLMAPKSGVGRVWQCSKWSMKGGLGASWLPRVGWEGFGKAKNEAWKGAWVFLMVPKSGVGRMEASAVGDSAGRRKRSLRLTRPLLKFTTWTLAFVPPFSGYIISIYFKSSFRCVDILWHNVQTGGFQNLNTSSVYCRSCLKHI